jgi:hypothetical protein
MNQQMNQHSLIASGATHQLYDLLLRATGRHASGAEVDTRRDDVRDRGAVSLEQVLWFVAAGVSVAIIAAILWNRIRDEANKPINTDDPLG